MLKRFDRRLVTILSIVFVQIAGAALILPILPLFAEREFAMHPATISLLVSAYFVTQFFAGPYLGQLSDQKGRVPILVISQIGSAVSFFMMAAAGSAWVLFAARALDGITGGNIIVAQAYITDITPREKRTEALGYIFAAFGLGFIIGPALGGLLSAWLGARMPFVIAGVASLATAGMSWLLLDETVGPKAKAAPAQVAQPPAVEAAPSGTAANPQPAAAATRPGGSPPAHGGGHGLPRVTLSPRQVASNTPLLLILLAAFGWKAGGWQVDGKTIHCHPLPSTCVFRTD